MGKVYRDYKKSNIVYISELGPRRSKLEKGGDIKHKEDQ
jgi:hypothetical protein